MLSACSRILVISETISSVFEVPAVERYKGNQHLLRCLRARNRKNI